MLNENTDTCTGCNELVSKVGILVGNVCYDCAVLCSECNLNPADPERGVCPSCQEMCTVEYIDVELDKDDRPSVCVACDISHYCELGTIPNSDKCIDVKDILIQNAETKP